MSDAPLELRLKDKGQLLQVRFADGACFDLATEYLRVQSPSAEVQGHSAAERKTVGGKRACSIVNLLPVGHYAIRPVFSDGHDTGIFAWDYLRQLGLEHTARWDSYLRDLDTKGLSREQPGEK